MSETANLKLFKNDNPTTNTKKFDVEKSLNENWDKLDENAGNVNEKTKKLEETDSAIQADITKLKETTKQNATEIEAIKQEQTTQSENIEKNAEGIAQNKKDVDVD